MTAAVIDELKARTTAYNTALGQKESSVAERKGVRGSMNDLFDTVDEMLTEEFDRAMQKSGTAPPDRNSVLQYLLRRKDREGYR